MLDFEKVIPEDVGISSTGLISFARKLEYNNIPMHSIIVMRHVRYVWKVTMHHTRKILSTECFL